MPLFGVTHSAKRAQMSLGTVAIPVVQEVRPTAGTRPRVRALVNDHSGGGDPPVVLGKDERGLRRAAVVLANGAAWAELAQALEGVVVEA